MGLSNDLRKLLGDETFKALTLKYGGAYIYIPVGDNTPLDVKRTVAKLHREGASISEIARAVGRSQRTVSRILELPVSSLK